MTKVIEQQIPINSDYDATTTSEQVMEGVDLTDRIAVVTGGYSGLGLQTTRMLVRAGATVIVPARRANTASATLAELPRTRVVQADLADQGSVHSAATEIAGAVDHIDFFFGTGGIMASPLERTSQGWESQFAVNHLGHFTFVSVLWPLLAQRGSRVVLYSSAGHHHSPIRWDDIDFRDGYDKWLAYGQSKTANVLTARQIAALGADVGVEAFSLHPGAILTPLQRHLPREEMVDLGWIDADGAAVDPTFKSVSQGAATGLWAATTTELSDHSGAYCEDCNVAPIAAPDSPMGDGGVKNYAIDDEQGMRLRQESEHRTGVTLGGLM